MSVYNFEGLGWYNFEVLVSCLSRELLGKGLSTFSGSKDQGRDATFKGKSQSFPSETEQWDGEWIVQVKHRQYSTQGAETTRKALLKLFDKEVSNLLIKYHHNVDNYVFVTNCPLTSTNKDDFLKIAQKYPKLKNVSILGESDIEQLVHLYPNIAHSFPQLLGMSQLKELTNWGLSKRSELFMGFAQLELSNFVVTRPYLDAVKLLHTNNFCILSGPPKMGKTCTSSAIAASFAADGFDVYELRKQEDFFSAFERGQKQLFICDDVFGDIYLDESKKDDWTSSFSKLLSGLDSNHKLIWTAREYILKEAFSTSRLKEEQEKMLNTDTVTVSVDKISLIEKAHILYNHAHSANLPLDIRGFLRSSAYEIASHESFSPESIRQLCTGKLVEFNDSSSEEVDLLKLVDTFLRQPREAWVTAFLHAKEHEQLVCTETLAAGGVINVNDLRERYNKKAKNGFPPFKEALDFSNGSFLKVTKQIFGGECVQFYHPSMRDVMVEVVKTHVTHRKCYLEQLQLNEISTIIKLPEGVGERASDAHKIDITNDDYQVLEARLRDELLPAAKLSELRSAILEITVVIKAYEKTNIVAPDYSLKFLNLLLEHSCTSEFWKRNKQESCRIWRFFLDDFISSHPLSQVVAVPVYILDLLDRFCDHEDLEFWDLANSANQIVPTIVSQQIDFKQRKEIYKELADSVADAVSSFYSINTDDYEELIEWHDTYSELIDDSEYYTAIFPDDELNNLDELLTIRNDNPCPDDEPDFDRDDYRVGELIDEQGIINEMFSDL